MIHPDCWLLPWGTPETDLRKLLAGAVETYLRSLGYEADTCWEIDLELSVISKTPPISPNFIGPFASTGAIHVAGIIDDSPEKGPI